MNNRLHNLKNPYQGQTKKVLCLCSAGLLRSPTAANVLHKEYGYNTRAAGSVDSYALIIADQYLLTWADEVVCMSSNQERYVELMSEKFNLDKVVINLQIPDNFAYMDEELQMIISRKYKEAIEGM